MTGGTVKSALAGAASGAASGAAFGLAGKSLGDKLGVTTPTTHDYAKAHDEISQIIAPNSTTPHADVADQLSTAPKGTTTRQALENGVKQKVDENLGIPKDTAYPTADEFGIPAGANSIPRKDFVKYSFEGRQGTLEQAFNLGRSYADDPKSNLPNFSQDATRLNITPNSPELQMFKRGLATQVHSNIDTKTGDNDYLMDPLRKDMLKEFFGHENVDNISKALETHRQVVEPSEDTAPTTPNPVISPALKIIKLAATGHPLVRAAASVADAAHTAGQSGGQDAKETILDQPAAITAEQMRARGDAVQFKKDSVPLVSPIIRGVGLVTTGNLADKTSPQPKPVPQVVNPRTVIDYSTGMAYTIPASQVENWYKTHPNKPRT